MPVGGDRGQHFVLYQYFLDKSAKCNQILPKHHWVRGKAALGFGADRWRTLVSMATDSFHRVIMGKTVSPLFLGGFSSNPFILAGNVVMPEISTF